MSAHPARQDIHAGNVSGTFIVGDNNHVTPAKHDAEQPQSRQENSAADQAAVFSVKDGIQYVTYHAATEPEAKD